MIQKIILIFFFISNYIVVYGGNNIENKNFYMASKTSLNNSLTEITVCEGESLELTAQQETNATYKWITSDNISVNNIDLIRTNVTLTMAGEYSLTVTVNGCSDTALINVIVLPKPNAGTNGFLKLVEGIEPTEEELFNALGGNPEPNGTWNKNNNTYTYTVTSANSCNSTATATVTVFNSIKVVNGFSPNGDNINDTWQILPNLPVKYPNNKLMVFNRFGNKVYEANPYNNDWNAVSNGKVIINGGKKLPPGPYYYVLELNNPKKTVFKGWVYINY